MKSKNEKKENNNEVKEKFGTKFIHTIKKKWLVNNTLTFALVVIIIAVFVLINIGMQKLELTPIDLTPEQTYTVSDESKEKVSGVDKQVNIYLIGYTDDAPQTVLAKQYHKANDKINVEAVDIAQRTDLAQKYGIDSSTTTQGIIVECGEKSKVLTANDLVSYDMNTYESSDVTEEKLTSSILTVTTDKVPNVYFLSGYSDLSLNNGLSYLGVYLQNEVMTVDTLDLISKGDVPENCDTLVITTPSKDFADVVANAIIKYINKGGNILWFNAAYAVKQDLPNVNKVLATYGVDAFSTGYILETDASKMISGTPYMIRPDVGASDVTEKIASAQGVLFVQPTKLNIQNSDKLKELKVEKEDLLTASSTSYFRSDLTNTSMAKTDKDEAGSFTVGAKLTKTIKDDSKSTLIIYGENYFISDMPIVQGNQTPLIAAYDNKDLALNSMATLTDREEDITVRKAKDDITYTATQQEDTVIKIIIFTVPCVIIIAGIVVWQVRRRKK